LAFGAQSEILVVIGWDAQALSRGSYDLQAKVDLHPTEGMGEVPLKLDLYLEAIMAGHLGRTAHLDRLDGDRLG
jgi:hypothetical protein